MEGGLEGARSEETIPVDEPFSSTASSGVSLRLVQELTGHDDRVWGLAWRPCGGSSILASCSGDKTIRVWEHAAGTSPSSASWACKMDPTFTSPGSVKSIVCVGQELIKSSKAVLDSSHTRTVRQVSWSPTGNLLASASFDATIGMWEYVDRDFSFIASFEGHENEVKSVAWNAAGTLLASCSRDKSVWIWEVLPGHDFECVSVLNGHTQDVKMLVWHPSLDVLVSTSYDNTIKVWTEEGDGDDWSCAQTLGPPGRGHTSTVWAASFNATGDRMVTCSDDLTLIIWDTSADLNGGDDSAKWKHLTTISGYHDRTIFSVHWSKLNGLIASGAGDDCIRIFSESADSASEESQSHELVHKHEKAHTSDVNSVQWHPRDPRLLASASDDGVVKIWELIGELPHASSATS